MAVLRHFDRLDTRALFELGGLDNPSVAIELLSREMLADRFDIAKQLMLTIAIQGLYSELALKQDLERVQAYSYYMNWLFLKSSYGLVNKEQRAVLDKMEEEVLQPKKVMAAKCLLKIDDRESELDKIHQSLVYINCIEDRENWETHLAR